MKHFYFEVTYGTKTWFATARANSEEGAKLRLERAIFSGKLSEKVYNKSLKATTKEAYENGTHYDDVIESKNKELPAI